MTTSDVNDFVQRVLDDETAMYWVRSVISAVAVGFGTFFTSKITHRLFTRKKKVETRTVIEEESTAPLTLDIEEESYTLATEEVLNSLNSPTSYTYNPERHTLHVPGLLVEFAAEHENPAVCRVIAGPRLVGSCWEGPDVMVLIPDNEKIVVYKACWLRRKTTIARDLTEKNHKAAMKIAMCRYENTNGDDDMGPPPGWKPSAAYNQRK